MSKDPVEAVKWYLKAAEQGNAKAQYLIGKYYAERNILSREKDLVQAVKWYRKAARRGSEDAQIALELYGL